jgi:hypothetical protein
MITIRETYEIFTPESIDEGDCEQSGWVDEEGTQYTFSELVELLKHCEASSSHPTNGTWATNYEYGNGTRDYFEKGIEETRSYHPVTDRDSRYFNKALNYISGR